MFICMAMPRFNNDNSFAHIQHVKTQWLYDHKPDEAIRRVSNSRCIFVLCLSQNEFLHSRSSSAVRTYVRQYWVVKNQNVCLFIDRLDFETSKECVAQRSRGRFWQLLCCEIEQSPSPFCTWGRLWSELERLGFVTPLALPHLLQFYNAMSQLCSDHRRIFLNCWIWKVSCRRR